MEIAGLIALSMGLAWASGLNLYAALAMLGIMGATGHMTLPPDLQVLATPAVIVAACIMYTMEFFADKVPGLDTGWDTFHTFIRIPAGAVLAAGALGQISPEAQVAALIIGGGITASTHTFKAGSRILINASPEPFSNWAASVVEDVVVIGGLLTAYYYPEAFLVMMALFALAMIWLLPKLWRGVRALFRRVAALFGRDTKAPSFETRRLTLKGAPPDGLSGGQKQIEG